jgi:hypothetical protein
VLLSSDPVHDLQRLTTWAVENGIPLDGLEVTRPSLEDVYLTLTQDDPVARDGAVAKGGTA